MYKFTDSTTIKGDLILFELFVGHIPILLILCLSYCYKCKLKSQCYRHLISIRECFATHLFKNSFYPYSLMSQLEARDLIQTIRSHIYILKLQAFLIRLWSRYIRPTLKL